MIAVRVSEMKEKMEAARKLLSCLIAATFLAAISGCSDTDRNAPVFVDPPDTVIVEPPANPNIDINIGPRGPGGFPLYPYGPSYPYPYYPGSPYYPNYPGPHHPHPGPAPGPHHPEPGPHHPSPGPGPGGHHH